MALEVSAAIIGILAAAGKVAETLGPVVSAFAHAPAQAQAIFSEVNHTSTILCALQLLFEDLSTSPHQRRNLIKLDSLVATLTDGVLLFSELETIVKRLGTAEPGVSIRCRAHWAKHKSGLEGLASRIKSFKISMVLMLSILQYGSDLEAQRDQQLLLKMTSDLLSTNADLANRIARLESSHGSSETVTTHRPVSSASTAWKALQSVNIEQGNQDPALSRLFMDTSLALEFERVLKESRVYRKAQQPTCDNSYRSSVAASHAWTVLSDISLSNISILSVVALPISLREISNAYHYGAYHASELVTSGRISGKNSDLKSQGPFSNNRLFTDIPDSILQLFAPAPKHLHPIKPLPSPPASTALPKTTFHPSKALKIVIKATSLGGMLEFFQQFDSGETYMCNTSSNTWEYNGTRVYDIDGMEVIVTIVYLSAFSEETYLHAVDAQYSQGDIFMLVYSNLSYFSVLRLVDFAQKIGRYNAQKIGRYKDVDGFPIMVVKNNISGHDSQQVTKEKEITSEVLGRNCSYREVNQADSNSVEEAIHDLIRQRWEFEKRAANEQEEREKQKTLRVANEQEECEKQKTLRAVEAQKGKLQMRRRLGKIFDGPARRGSAAQVVRKGQTPLTPVQE